MFFTAKLDYDKLSVLCSELADILGSGMTFGEGFVLLAAEEPDAGVKSALDGIARVTTEGGGVAEAMAASGLFPDHVERMMSVAERTGAGERVLRELGAYYRRLMAMRRAVRSAVTYPVILFLIVLAVFFVFLTEVLPIFSRVFEQIGAIMSPVAGAFLGFGLWLAGAKWYILGVLGAIAVFVLLCLFVPKLKAWAGKRLSNLFAGMKTGRAVERSDLASVLSLAVTGSSDIAEALSLAERFSGGDRGGKLERCRDAVLRGESFAETAEREELFDPMCCRMLAIAERTGTMEKAMGDVAERTAGDASRALDAMTGRVEPIAVIVLTLLVGLLLLSVMLPLVGIMSAL